MPVVVGRQNDIGICAHDEFTGAMLIRENRRSLPAIRGIEPGIQRVKFGQIRRARVGCALWGIPKQPGSVAVVATEIHVQLVHQVVLRDIFALPVSLMYVGMNRNVPLAIEVGDTTHAVLHVQIHVNFDVLGHRGHGDQQGKQDVNADV